MSKRSFDLVRTCREVRRQNPEFGVGVGIVCFWSVETQLLEDVGNFEIIAFVDDKGFNGLDLLDF